jgi:thiaminase
MVEKIKFLVNKAAEEFPYRKLKSVFMAASRYELMFWEAVYNKEQWPI